MAAEPSLPGARDALGRQRGHRRGRRPGGPRPAAIRRLLNLPVGDAVADELARLAVEDGVGTFIVMADDAASVEAFATEVAPAVRALVDAARTGPAPVARARTGRRRARGSRTPGADASWGST